MARTRARGSRVGLVRLLVIEVDQCAACYGECECSDEKAETDYDVPCNVGRSFGYDDEGDEEADEQRGGGTEVVSDARMKSVTTCRLAWQDDEMTEGMRSTASKRGDGRIESIDSRTAGVAQCG